jgi:hypothetical protein
MSVQHKITIILNILTYGSPAAKEKLQHYNLPLCGGLMSGTDSDSVDGWISAKIRTWYIRNEIHLLTI